MRIFAISTSSSKGTRKGNVQEALLRQDHGIVKDAHAGEWHRQISLLAVESIRKMTAKGLDVGPGDFAENITTEGIDLLSLPLGQKLCLGDGIIIEVTQRGKECRERCAVYYQAGDCVMPREGIFARVLSGGIVRIGDPITVIGAGDMT